MSDIDVPRRFQITVDCRDPAALASFWARVLRYALEEPPAGFASWNEYWVDRGVPPEELSDEDEAESIVDPQGVGPRIWFQIVPEAKATKNRIHFDVDASEGRSISLDRRREQVDAEVERVVTWGGTALRTTNSPEADQYCVLMQDPEGNEFCIR